MGWVNRMMPPQPGPPGAQPQGGAQPPPPNPELQKAQQQLQQIEQQLTQIQENKQVLQLLRDEKTRGYRIEIETDSTIEPDEQAEKKSRIEFTEITGKFLGEALPILQIMPQAAPLFRQALLFLVRGFRVGREMEDTIETVMQQISQAAQQPKPDPEQQKIEAQLKQSEQQHQQTMAQSDQQHQQTLQQKGVEFQQKMALEQMKAQHADEQHQATMQANQQQAQLAEKTHGMDIQAKQEDRQTAQQTAQLQFEGMDREQTRTDAAHQQKTQQNEQTHGANMKEREDAGIQANAGELKDAIGELVKMVETTTKDLKGVVGEIVDEMAAPAELIRGKDGKPAGIRKGKRTRSISRGADGAISGMQ